MSAISHLGGRDWKVQGCLVCTVSSRPDRTYVVRLSQIKQNKDNLATNSVDGERDQNSLQPFKFLNWVPPSLVSTKLATSLGWVFLSCLLLENSSLAVFTASPYGHPHPFTSPYPTLPPWTFSLLMKLVSGILSLHLTSVINQLLTLHSGLSLTPERIPQTIARPPILVWLERFLHPKPDTHPYTSVKLS